MSARIELGDKALGAIAWERMQRLWRRLAWQLLG